MKKILVCLCLLAFLPSVMATTFRALSFDEIVTKAELAFYGTVVDVNVRELDGEPWTLVQFDVTESYYGVEEAIADEADDADDDAPVEDEPVDEFASVGQVSLLFYGGAFPDGDSLSVSLMPNFEIGEQVLVMAYRKPYYSPIVGFRQGLWRDTPSGLTDEQGRKLSINADGNIILEGEGDSTANLLAAVAERFAEKP